MTKFVGGKHFSFKKILTEDRETYFLNAPRGVSSVTWNVHVFSEHFIRKNRATDLSEDDILCMLCKFFVTKNQLSVKNEIST